MTDTQTLFKTAVLVNNYSLYLAGEARFFYCDFWRSRRGHIWEPPGLPHHTLRRSTDMQAVLSFLLDEVDFPLCRATRLVDYCKQHGIQFNVRGLRAAQDFNYEFEMQGINCGIAPDIKTVLLVAPPEFQFICSSTIR